MEIDQIEDANLISNIHELRDKDINKDLLQLVETITIKTNGSD